jgi:hypothetical protein
MSNGNGKAESVAVLFDFDGTVGDTETPAMEVAFWEAAPYLVGICECFCSITIRTCSFSVFERNKQHHDLVLLKIRHAPRML